MDQALKVLPPSKPFLRENIKKNQGLSLSQLDLP